MNEHESAAMWAVYSTEGIAVQSTFSRYVSSLPQRTAQPGVGEIFVGVVNYIDYDREHFSAHGNAFARFMHKRLSFAHERELRGVIMQLGTESGTEWDDEVDAQQIGIRIIKPTIPQEGIDVPADLTRLVETVYVAPTAPMWFYKTVLSVVKSYGFAFPVHRSVLNEDPIY